MDFFLSQSWIVSLNRRHMLILIPYLVHQVVLSQHLVLVLCLTDERERSLISLSHRRVNDVLIHLFLILLPQSLTDKRSFLLMEHIFLVNVASVDYHAFEMLGVFGALSHNVLSLGITSGSGLDLVWLRGRTEG